MISLFFTELDPPKDDVLLLRWIPEEQTEKSLGYGQDIQELLSTLKECRGVEYINPHRYSADIVVAPHILGNYRQAYLKGELLDRLRNPRKFSII